MSTFSKLLTINTGGTAKNLRYNFYGGKEMVKFYEIKQVEAVGNGYSTTLALVINPSVRNGGYMLLK